MRHKYAILLAAVFAAACGDSAGSQAPSAPRSAHGAPSANAQGASQEGLQWGPAPAVLPPGAEIAVLQGDPSKSEEFTIRLRFPNGYLIPPHTHPTVENVTVLTGTFLAGMGAQVVESQMQALGRDGFVSIPAEHAHYAKAQGLTVIQLHAIGPFALTYVNPDGSPKP